MNKIFLMNKLTTTLIATALASTIGTTALTSAVVAQESGQPPAHNGPKNTVPMSGFMAGFGGMGRLCAPNNGKNLEATLSRVAQRIELNADQTEAFETFRAEALVAQTALADTCAQVKPGEDADLIDRLNAGQAIMAVRLEGMGDVLPSLEIFYDSLSDAQKARMRPSRMARRQLPHQGTHTHAPKDPDNTPQNSGTPGNGDGAQG